MAENNDLIRPLLLIVAAVVALPVLVMVFAWPMMGMWSGGHMWDGGMWSGTGISGLWLVMWLLPLVILLGGGYFLYRAITRPDGEGVDPAIEALRLAYARGKLSEEEFEKRRDRLQRENEL